MDGATQKGPLWPESLSYQKKDGRAGPRPPFFWFYTDFQKKKKKKKSKNFKKFFFQKILKSRCHTKRRYGAPRARPSFGMTTTQAIRDLFAYRSTNNQQKSLRYKDYINNVSKF